MMQLLLAYRSRKSLLTATQGRRSGQALMETLLVLPALTVILFATFWIGASFWLGSRASNAIKQPMFEKFVLGNTPEAWQDFEILRMVNSAENGSSILNIPGAGRPVDGIVIRDPGHITAIVTGWKDVDLSSISFFNGFAAFPNFRFWVVQGLDSQLLKAVQERQLADAGWTPPVVRVVDPTAFGLDASRLPGIIAMNRGCSASDMIDGNYASSRYSQDLYDLDGFSSPAQTPAVGGISSNFHVGNYTNNRTLQALVSAGNYACDNSKSLDSWGGDCENEYDKEFLGQCTVPLPPCPSTTTPQTTGTTGTSTTTPSTSTTSSTSSTSTDTTSTSTTTTTPTCDPTITSPQTVVNKPAAGVNPSTLPAGSTYSCYAADAPPVADYKQQCQYAKQMSCRMAYAAAFAASVRATLAGGSGDSTNCRAAFNNVRNRNTYQP
jgi:hypothetical protein